MAGRWDGATFYYSRNGGVSYQPLDFDADAATFGVASTALAAFSTTGAFDDTNTVDITLTQGTDQVPTSFSDADVIAGQGAVWIGDELVQAGTVVNLGSNQYRLSHLLRGRRGTDAFWNKHVIGERAVLDNGGIKRYVLPSDLVGSMIRLKAVGSGLAEADVTDYIEVIVRGQELSAYAPVHLTGSRDVPALDDLLIGWTRRARKRGDLEDSTDVPLDYAEERYFVLCLSSASTSIASVTKAQQCVMDIPGHNFSVSQFALFTDIAGMIELNGVIAQCVAIDAINPNLVTFALDTRDMGTYAAPPGNSWRARRVITATSNSTTYLESDQSSDFGSPQDPLQVAIAQLNDSGVPGYALTGFV